jgi:threonine aldolase
MTANNVVDLRSDTMTKPTAGMREAIARAAVGDDVVGEDPTVNALQERVANLACKEAALFVPSGTMANLVAMLAQTRPGDTVILEAGAHPQHYESGNLAMIGGLMAKTLPGESGILRVEDIAAAHNSGADHHCSPTTLVCIENTANRGGGTIYPLKRVVAIGEAAHEQGMKVHCDGARIFNAVVASGMSLAQYAAPVDTLSFCFSKGLGAPVGSILVGDAEIIDRAHRFRKMLGGGMRQVGVLAAAALYALDHHVERLAEDHDRARRFREALEGTRGITFPGPSPTNIVYVEVEDAPGMTEYLKQAGVLVGGYEKTRIRVVFHLDVDDAGLERAIEAFLNTAG